MTPFRPLTYSGLNRTQMMEVYRHLLKTHGPAKPEALGWRGPDSQIERFRILVRDVKPHSRLIDYGCGLGDLYGFLTRVNLPLDYKGIDIMPETVRAARSKYPRGRFAIAGSLRNFPSKSYDYIVSSGVFSLRLVDHFNLVLRTMADFARVARQGFALDLPALEYYPSVAEDPVFFSVDRDTLQDTLRKMNFDFDLETDRLQKSHFIFVRNGVKG